MYIYDNILPNYSHNEKCFKVVENIKMQIFMFHNSPPQTLELGYNVEKIC